MSFQKNHFIKFFVIGLLTLSSCQLSRMIIYNFADINDYKIFPSRPLFKSNHPFHFYYAKQFKHPEKINDIPFDKFLEKTKTVAFIVIKNDTIQYEKYFHSYTDSKVVPSFSMAKSITSILIGCAIDDKLIDSENDAVTKYIPELAKNGFDKVTIKHLLQMTSGLDFNENYFNPFSDAATFYYGRNIRKRIIHLKLKYPLGTKFEYNSGNTQLLGLVLERALKEKSITEYLQEKIWTPLGMEFDASWSIDKKKNGIEKTFCCINAVARDYAKIGRLYLHKGKWNEQQIVSEKWVEKSIQSDTTEGSVNYYQYNWWLPTPGKDFLAEGFLGQYIYVNPSKNLIIVRLGKKEGKTNWWKVFRNLASNY